MITRVVMVEFHPDTDAIEVESFKAGLRELAARARGLISMSCGEHRETEGDVVLTGGPAPSVVVGDFVSIWEFRDRAALNEFLVDPVHRELASRWRAAVKSRYVINME
jgi:hypothetical protein